MTIDDLLLKARGFQESRVLLTALDLDLFTAVGSGASSQEVAARLATDRRATAVLLDALVAVGALVKHDGAYRNTPATARHLTAGSPENLRPGLLHTVHLWETWSSLTEVVRTGQLPRAPGVDARDAGWTEAFIDAMHQNAVQRAERLVGGVGARTARRLLDVGGGSGAYSIAFARAAPDLHADVLDVAAVVPMAERRIAEAGLSGRVRTRVGDLRRDDLGTGYDLVLVSAICHMLDPGENRDLLRRCGLATAPDGRVVIRDFVLDADRTSPKAAALFAINMLVGTRGGSTYTWDEYRTWLSEAGYVDVRRLDEDPDVIVGRRP